MTFDLHWVKNGIIFDYSGDVTSEDIVNSNAQVYGDSRFDDLRFELANFLEIKKVSFTPKDVRLVAAMDIAAFKSNPRISVALVASTPEIHSLLEEYVIHSVDSPWHIATFQELEDAKTWIENLEPR